MTSETQRLLINNNVKQNGSPTTHLQDNNKTTFQQILIRILVLVSFAIAKEVERLSQKQYIYRWIETNNVVNKTSQTHNSSLLGPCGENISAAAEKVNQHSASQWMWYFTVTEHGFAIIVIIFYGIYSDFIGRKPLMLISEVGYIFRFGIISFIIYKDLHIKYFFVAYSISGICGCQYSFYLGTVASIADKTERDKSRSIGFAFFESLVGIGVSLSDLGTGYIIKFTGYLYPIIISEGLTILNLAMLCICMPETMNNAPTERLTFKIGIKRLFGFYYNKSKITNGKRWKFNTTMLAYFVSYLLLTAQGELNVLYQMRSPFCWTSETVGNYGFIMYMSQYVIGIAALRILQNYARDEFVAVIGCISGIVSYILEGIAQTSLMLYIAGGIGFMSAVPLPLLKSMCSRMVDTDLQGALFANMSVMENICMFCASSVFNNIYGLTQNFMPGFVFILLGSAFVIPAVLSIMVSSSKDTRD